MPSHQPIKVGVWHALVEAYIESCGFPGWTHLHPTFYMEVGALLRSVGLTTPALPLAAPLTRCRPSVLLPQNLVEYGGVKTIQNREVVTPFDPQVKVTWVSAEDIGLVGAAVMTNPAIHAGRVYPLVADAGSHAEFAELLSKMAGQSYRVKQLPIRDWYRYINEHVSKQIEVSHHLTPLLPSFSYVAGCELGSAAPHPLPCGYPFVARRVSPRTSAASVSWPTGSTGAAKAVRWTALYSSAWLERSLSRCSAGRSATSTTSKAERLRRARRAGQKEPWSAGWMVHCMISLSFCALVAAVCMLVVPRR